MPKNSGDTDSGNADVVTTALGSLRQAALEARLVTDLDQAETGTDLIATSASGALSVKAQLAAIRADAAKKQTALLAAQHELKAKMDAEIARANQIMEPLNAMIKRLEEGIWTVNLYLGRDEQMVTLREGAPAPADTPIAIRQQVLAMDEEVASRIEEEGMDANNLEDFDNWILADATHLAQVLPEPKGVVVLIPRRQEKEYGNSFYAARMKEANRQSYWLIRNGDNLYRMVTDLKVGDRLIPKSDEFVRFFQTEVYNPVTRCNETQQLEPGSKFWLQAEKQADARKRHFMRVALVLQGLLDRTTVFRPITGGINLLSHEAYDDGRVKLIADAEHTLHDGTEPFYRWLARLNQQLRPGMRIVGAFNSRGFQNERREHGGGNRRIAPRMASDPRSLVIYRLDERRSDGGLVFHFDRTDTVWRNWREESGPAKRKASCVVYPRDDFILPFDLVNESEMEHYLALRTERHAYLDMFPVLKAAITLKRAEVEAEASFRDLLVGELIKREAISYDDATVMVPELVHWWKLANRWHRPLVNNPEQEAKALRMILAEAGLRLRPQSEPASLAVARLREVVPDPVLLAQKRDGTVVAWMPAEAARNVFVHEYSLPKSGRGEIKKKEWMLPNPRHAQWRVIATSSRWSHWNHAATRDAYLTDPERTSITREALERTPEESQAMVVVVDEVNALVRLWLSPELPSIPEHHLIARTPVLKCPTLSWHWKKGRNGEIVLDVSEDGMYSFDWTGSDPPWAQRHWDYGVALPEQDMRTTWSDEVLLSRVLRFMEELNAYSAECGRRRDLAMSGIYAFIHAFEARETELARLRFVEDFGEDAPWDPGKHEDQYHPPERIMDLVRAAMTIVADGGESPSGMSMSDVLDRLRPLGGSIFNVFWVYGSPQWSAEQVIRELEPYSDLRLSE